MTRKIPGGARQRAWTALRAGEAMTIAQVADVAETTPLGIKPYLVGLAKHGYLDEVDGGFKLARNTGSRSPSYNIHTGVLRDWNLNPPMPAVDFTAIFERFGGSILEFTLALGFNEGTRTRVRQMLAGSRPVTDATRDAALALAEKLKDGSGDKG